MLQIVTTFATSRRVTAEHRLRLVVYQDVPGVWVGRGIEHDLTAEGRSIGETVRAVLRMVQAHTAYDARHDRPPLSAFRPAPQACWNAFNAGTPIPLAQLGALPPVHWDIAVSIARHRPSEGRFPWPIHGPHPTQHP
jgi:hypothetical protein